MDINLTKRLQKSFAPWPRTRGRYSSSEVYGILKGWLTPEEWLNPPKKKIKDIFNMWNGIGTHNQLEKLMGTEHSEKKVEYHYKDITLVGKADFLPPHKLDQVWEFKTSTAKIFDKAKPWHLFQVKLYTTMFEKKEGVIYQPVQLEEGLILKDLGMVDRDDKWFEEQLQLLYKFHEKVEELWKKQSQQ